MDIHIARLSAAHPYRFLVRQVRLAGAVVMNFTRPVLVNDNDFAAAGKLSRERFHGSSGPLLDYASMGCSAVAIAQNITPASYIEKRFLLWILHACKLICRAIQVAILLSKAAETKLAKNSASEKHQQLLAVLEPKLQVRFERLHGDCFLAGDFRKKVLDRLVTMDLTADTRSRLVKTTARTIR